MDEFELMKIAYEIGKHLQSFYTEDLSNKSKLHADFSVWNVGVHPNWTDTNTGLILRYEYYLRNVNGYTLELYTPWGEWTVLKSSTRSNAAEIMHKEAVLVLMKKFASPVAEDAQWEILSWKGKDLPRVTYSFFDKSHTYEECKENFKKFANSFENTLSKEVISIPEKNSQEFFKKEIAIPADEFGLMKVAYEVGIHLQSFYTEDSNDESKPYAHFPFWNDGPNSWWYQTNTGLVLHEENGVKGFSLTLDTPWGKWKVLSADDLREVTEMMHKESVLVLRDKGSGEYSTWNNWEITTWKGKDLPRVTDLSSDDLRDYCECEDKFEKFANSFENTLNKE